MESEVVDKGPSLLGGVMRSMTVNHSVAGLRASMR